MRLYKCKTIKYKVLHRSLHTHPVGNKTLIMLKHKKVKDFKFKPIKTGYAIKVPVFSFNKFPINPPLPLIGNQKDLG